MLALDQELALVQRYGVKELLAAQLSKLRRSCAKISLESIRS